MKRFISVLVIAVLSTMLFFPSAYAATIKEYLDARELEELIAIRDYINYLIDQKQLEKGDVGFVSFGDAGIKYKSAYMKNDGGEAMLVIVFDWVNNSDSGTSFGSKFSFEAYQDGFGLSTGIIWGFDTEFSTKIVPGKTIEGYYIWELRNTKDPVTVKIDRFLDLTDKYQDLELKIDLSKVEIKK